MTRIIVPPGIGDGYWVLVKLRGFMEQHGIRNADIYVHDSPPRRSSEMWLRVPFVRFAGWATLPRMIGKKPSRVDVVALKRAYRLAGHAVQRNVGGYDWFLSLNGCVDHGMTLDQAMRGPTNWYEQMHDPRATEMYAASFRARFDRYVMATFWAQGSYGKWLAQFPESAIAETLSRIADSGLRVVIAGAEWDRGGIAERLAATDPRHVSLVAETNYDQLCGLIAGAEAVTGFPAGSSLIAPYFRKPTVLLWNAHFPRAMWMNTVPPTPLYTAIDTAEATPELVAGEVTRMIGRRAAA